MKYFFSTLIALLTFFSCKKEEAKTFSDEGLNTPVQTIDGTSVQLKEVFANAKGKTTFVDIWAAWCPDCIGGMPKVQSIQKEYGDKINYIFISIDRNETQWKNAIEKFGLQGNHYWIKDSEDWDKIPFAKSINLRSIPRYMVINKEGEITVFNATDASDKAIETALKQ